MKQLFKKSKTIFYFSMFGMLAVASTAHAGAFQLLEENVTNLGNAYAGTGAQADDASTEWFNPAGMTRIKHPQFVVSSTDIDLSINSNATSARVKAVTAGGIGIFDTAITGSSYQQPGANVPVPSIHFVYPFNDKLAWGFGVNVPFGLKTQYDASAMARYLATKSAIEDVSFGPSIAYQITKYLSIGAGLDIHYMKTELDQFVYLGAAEGNFTNKLDGFARGWHAGILLQPSTTTRFGFTYHSQVNQALSGTATLQSTTVGISNAGTVSSTYTTPDSANLSAYHELDKHWAILGSIDYTHWSVLKDVTLNFSGPLASEVSSISAPLNFRDTYRLALGANYRWNEQLLFRIGTAWDQSPVPDNESRTFRLPDSDRIWFALGAQYKLNNALTFDAGYSHLFGKNSEMNNQLPINVTLPVIGNTIITASGAGTFNSSVNEFGLQVTWNIDHD